MQPMKQLTLARHDSNVRNGDQLDAHIQEEYLTTQRLLRKLPQQQLQQ